jgi:phenylacetate-CoA ligase
MSGLSDYIYARSPIWLQNIGVTLYGFYWHKRRFGGDFKRYIRSFEVRETYSSGDWRAYQSTELQRLLAHATRHVPYYRRAYAEQNRQDFASFDLDRLSELPLLEKETVRSTPDLFVADNISPRTLSTFNTSGTTGTPLAVKYSKNFHRRWSAAYETRVRRWSGVDHSMSRAMIGGRIIVPKAESKPPFWRYNYAEKQLYMSAFHISPDNAPFYVDALNQYKPDYLVGYASSHFFLARMINEQGLEVMQPKAVLTSSEKLTADMRAAIEEAYRCPVFDAYSGVEACCLASECEHHRLHLSPDVGIVELLGEDGHPVERGEVGELVATGLLNFDQPLIRYRTGDLAAFSEEPCPCERSMPVLEELVGRLEDTVIGKDGREMVRFHGIFVALPHVQEGQVIQESLTHFRLRLVVKPGFGDEERQIIRGRFQERLGDVTLSFEYVDRIERTERGKFRAVISHVDRSTVSGQGNI